ncbi:MAG TPA: hypothetical protein DSN98_05380 [Thermoplasmata archaeon]|nr:MAG TPA: hypothetical protein DSN98_05380 [Thermoplasmata archaeon]
MFFTQEVFCIVKGTRRHRYIGFCAAYQPQNHAPTNTELIQALRQATYDLYSKNTKELGLWVIRFDGTSGILKCHYREKEHAIALLQSLKKIGPTTITITTHATSGTIHGLGEKKIKRPQ